MQLKNIRLGNTGITVTELCFGALPIGPNQKNVAVEEAARIIARALRLGVTFVDTAYVYKTYPHIRRAMELTGIRPVIASKSPAETYAEMESHILRCRQDLGVDTVDIFLLHAARVGTDVFEKRGEALRCLLDYKARGYVRAVGISTHGADVAALAADRPDIDIVFPILNRTGMGVLGGSREDMERAVERCLRAGKGVYLMKALAGGNLVGEYEAAFAYARNAFANPLPIAVGMVSEEEVEMNVRYFRGEDISGYAQRTAPVKEFFVLKGICASCGKCVETCHSAAITLAEGVPVIDRSRCLTCGYCVNACPQFAIRMI